MPYQINRTDGTLLTNVQDYTKDTETTSLTLLGRGSVDYGESVAENFVHMLEHFASPTPPTAPLQGQTWFQTFDPGPPVSAVNKLKVFDGSSWINVGGAQSSVGEPENPEPGDLWYNIEDSQIYYWDGFQWKKVGGPFTGVPGDQDPAELPDDTIIAPPADPKEGDLWWMLPERKLWAYDSSLASLSSFPPKVPRVDGSLVPNGWVLIGPQGIQNPNDPAGGSYNETRPETVIDPVTGEEEEVPLFMIVLDGKIISVWTPKLIKLKQNTIAGMAFAAWADPYDPDASTLTLQPGLNQNHGSLMVINGQISDSERLNGLNSSQFLRSDETTYPTTTDVVYDLGTPEQHWRRFFAKEIYSATSKPDGEPDLEEVSIFGKASAAEKTDYAEKAKMFFDAKNLKTTGDVEVKFDAILNTEATDWTGTANLTQAGKDAVKVISDASASEAVAAIPKGNFVNLDKDSIPVAGVNQGNAGTRWGTIYANVFDGVATQAKYADLAERYEADRVYPIGTLLSLGGDKEVTITSGQFDTNYFGVVSAEPAFLMNSDAGEDLDMFPPVAMVGRVLVRVVGPVKKGQRLTVSHLPGVAVGAADNNPTFLQEHFVVGRALVEKTTEGEELILAVVFAVK